MRHFIFFDIETTGLIKSKGLAMDFRNTDIFPEIVQISWQLFQSSKGILTHIHSKDFIIRPEGYTIPEESSNIHKITNEIASENGLDKIYVLQNFINDIQNYENIHIVCHNFEFDVTILFFHIYKNFKDIFSSLIHTKIPCICTMLDTVDVCKLPSIKMSNSKIYKGQSQRNFYKYPKLSELHKNLFGEEPDGTLHNSSFDVEVLVKCFKELISRKANIKIRYSNFVCDYK